MDIRHHSTQPKEKTLKRGGREGQCDPVQGVDIIGKADRQIGHNMQRHRW